MQRFGTSGETSIRRHSPLGNKLPLTAFRWGKMGDYEKLHVWRKSHGLTCDVYRLTAMLPARHHWPLGDQMRRAALSVGTNIVEGCGRNHVGHFRNSITVSLGEANELHYLLLIARDVEARRHDVAMPMRTRADEIRRMLSGLLESTRHGGRPDK
jgi:four helix bundle protein